MQDTTSSSSLFAYHSHSVAQLWYALVMFDIRPQTNCSEADSIIKVPEMAESITEGTLKQFSKRTFGGYKYPNDRS